MLARLMDHFAHWYFPRFPIDRGKWRLWERIGPFLKLDRFGEVERTIRHGIRMKLDLSDHIDHVIYYWNCWEPYETWAVEGILRPGDTFVDVGANIGYFTLVASRIVGRQGRVFSFEPVPPTAERLKVNVGLNDVDNVAICEYAVSDRAETVKIGKSDRMGSGMSTMRVNGTMNEAWEVPAVRLDEFLSRDRPIRLVKIDVEGAELRVLKGFAAHLESGRVPYVLCEVMDPFLKELGGSAEELYSLMVRLGYRAYSCKNRRFIPISLSAIRRKPYQTNVLFSKEAMSPSGPNR